jgi:DNA polymerase (family 10)
MDKKEVAEILDEIGTLLELRGENTFKCRAYHNASRTISTLTQDLKQLIATNELENIKGIGKALSGKIIELVETGKLRYFDDLKQSLPPGLTEMLRIQGLGPKKVKLLYENLKIKSIGQLKQAASKHKLSKLDGFGEKTEENILKGIELLSSHVDKHLYSQARNVADDIMANLKKQRGVIRCEVAGSLRRHKETIGDIDILISVKQSDIKNIMDVFTSHPDVEKVIARGETKSSVLLRSLINCDLRVVNDVEYPFALAYFTGSKEHNVEMRSLANKFGWSLNEYGFSIIGSGDNRDKPKRIIKCETEKDIFNALKLGYIPPELRENMGEIESAMTGTLPNLIKADDIRGTFHCHTNSSDGMNTLEELAEAAQKLGWEYLGIADHSKSAVYAGGLTAERVKLQLKEIEKLNRTFTNFRLFAGTEADIITDGSLDWKNDTLECFDFVIVAIHNKFKMTETEATKRIIKALKKLICNYARTSYRKIAFRARRISG